MRVIAAAAIVSMLNACSLVLVNGPPDPVPPEGPIHCDTMSGGPVLLDILVGTLGGLFMGYLAFAVSGLGGHSNPDPPSDSEAAGGAVVVGGLVALPWYLSAYAGISRASDCRDVKAKTGR